MTGAERAAAEALRAELLLRSPAPPRQRELTSAQEAALRAKGGPLSELVAENDMAARSGGGSGTLEVLAEAEVSQGVGALLSNVAAVALVGALLGGAYFALRRRAV
jgi:hypothetical protein